MLEISVCIFRNDLAEYHYNDKFSISSLNIIRNSTPVVMTNFISYVVQEGRTPLHYAAALQGTTGGHNQLYSALVDAGASEDVVDVVGQRLSFQT